MNDPATTPTIEELQTNMKAMKALLDQFVPWLEKKFEDCNDTEGSKTLDRFNLAMQQFL